VGLFKSETRKTCYREKRQGVNCLHSSPNVGRRGGEKFNTIPRSGVKDKKPLGTQQLLVVQEKGRNRECPPKTASSEEAESQQKGGGKK